MNGSALYTAIGIIIALIGAFYCDLRWELRKSRKRLHLLEAKLGSIYAVLRDRGLLTPVDPDYYEDGGEQ